jgi:hypothetical protein
MEITLRPDYGSLNFEVVPRFLVKLYTSGLFIYLSIYFILLFI